MPISTNWRNYFK